MRYLVTGSPLTPATDRPRVCGRRRSLPRRPGLSGVAISNKSLGRGRADTLLGDPTRSKLMRESRFTWLQSGGLVMRILVVGAGALGGYFGACLLRFGRDVTFLVRAQRAAQMAREGLRVIGKGGDFAVAAPTVLATELHETFDLILVAVKAYSFDEAVK